MGALFAGVFCGVLGSKRQYFPPQPFIHEKRGKGKKESESPYGATGKSAFLFLMGSDMAT